MTDDQKTMIHNLREQGVGYVRIAKVLGLSENTVKSYCQRNGLNAKKITTIKLDDIHVCKFCGKEVKQNPGRKEKKFCNSTCRQLWWNSHLDKVNRKAIYEYECEYCHLPFTAYGNSHRRYCSQLCYLTARYGYRAYRDNKYEESPLFSSVMHP